ncbi:MAG: hypothetical protein AAF909_04250 [Pseudomonadota bacterium]
MSSHFPLTPKNDRDAEKRRRRDPFRSALRIPEPEQPQEEQLAAHPDPVTGLAPPQGLSFANLHPKEDQKDVGREEAEDHRKPLRSAYAPDLSPQYDPGDDAPEDDAPELSQTEKTDKALDDLLEAQAAKKADAAVSQDAEPNGAEPKRRTAEEKVFDDLGQMIGGRAVAGALGFSGASLPAPERAEVAEDHAALRDNAAAGDTQGAVPPLRKLVRRREQALPTARAERRPARGPDAPDLPYLDKADQAEDFALAMKSGPDAERHREKARRRSDVSTSFVETPPVLLARHQDDPPEAGPPEVDPIKARAIPLRLASDRISAETPPAPGEPPLVEESDAEQGFWDWLSGGAEEEPDDPPRESRAETAARVRQEVVEELAEELGDQAWETGEAAGALGHAIWNGREIPAAPAATREEIEAAFSLWASGAPLPRQSRLTPLEEDFYDWAVVSGIRSAPSVALTESGRRRDANGKPIDPRHWIGALVSDPEQYTAARHESFLLFAAHRAAERRRQSGASVFLRTVERVGAGVASGAYDTVMGLPDAPERLIESVEAIERSQEALKAQRRAFLDGDLDIEGLRRAEREAWETQAEHSSRIASYYPGGRIARDIARGVVEEGRRGLDDLNRAFRRDDFDDFDDFGGAAPVTTGGPRGGRMPPQEGEWRGDGVVERLDDDPGRGAIAAPTTLDSHPPGLSGLRTEAERTRRLANQASVQGQTLSEVVRQRPRPKSKAEISAERAFFRDIVPDNDRIPEGERAAKGLDFSGGPTTRFEHAFDSLPDADFDACWARRSCQDAMKGRLRSPGGFHEHLMLEQVPHMRKNLDVTAAEIRGLDYRTKTGELHLKVPGTDRTVTHKDGSEGGEAWEVSRKFHSALSKTIASSRTRAELVENLHRLAEKWLPGGVGDLPAGLGAR